MREVHTILTQIVMPSVSVGDRFVHRLSWDGGKGFLIALPLSSI